MPKIKKKKVKYLKVSEKKKEDIIIEDKKEDVFLTEEVKIVKKKKINQDSFEPCYAELKEGVSYTVRNNKFLKNVRVYLTDKKVIESVSVNSRFEITKGE